MSNQGWLRSGTAYRLFSYSAWTVVAVGLFMIFMLTPWFQQIDSLRGGDLTLKIVAAPIGILGAPASLILWFGMAFFCVREDRSTVSAKVLWFVLFLATACFGSAIYFFAVYKTQTEHSRLPV